MWSTSLLRGEWVAVFVGEGLSLKLAENTDKP